ncbi:MAG: hypothetical protein J4N26_00650, partial [Chloroflexi bacterium]|nr:hypothetical protein [Chloroflexota bacterium]
MPALPLPPALLERWRLAGRVRSVERIAGGELKDVYRIDVEGGSPSLCLRLYPPEVTLETVASELRWVDQFAEHVPEVPASI